MLPWLRVSDPCTPRLAVLSSCDIGVQNSARSFRNDLVGAISSCTWVHKVEKNMRQQVQKLGAMDSTKFNVFVLASNLKNFKRRFYHLNECRAGLLLESVIGENAWLCKVLFFFEVKLEIKTGCWPSLSQRHACAFLSLRLHWRPDTRYIGVISYIWGSCYIMICNTTCCDMQLCRTN